MEINKRESISTKFQELIDKSRLKRKRLCEGFSDDIYQNALDFTFDNIKIDKVLNEVHPSGGGMLSDDLTKMTVESCLSQLESIAHALSSPLNLVTSQVMARALIGLLQQNSDVGHRNCHLLDEMARIKVLSLLDLIKKINASNSFDKVNFVKCLANEDVAVELVWLLNKESLVSVRSYLSSWYEDDNWVEYFSLSIKSLCCDACPASADLRENIVQVIIGALLEIGYAEASERDLIQQKAKETIFKAVSYVEREIETCSSDESKDWLCVYKVARELTHVSADIIRMFFHDILIEAIGRPCNVTVEEAIACQEKWTSEFLSEATILKYQQFIIVCSNEAVMQIFERAVDSIKSEAVNIEVMAHLLTVFLIYVDDAFKLFDDFLQRCISETVENCDFPQLRLLLLLRRQAALEGSHVSPSYSHWFEKTFVLNGASLGLNSKRTMQFFFKALSDLVPYERPEYLKVHIFKSAQISVKFKYYVEDYVVLAKTRLADLNESLEDSGAGIFRQSHCSVNDEQSKVMEQARVDVEKVLKLYEESGRVPTTIMEASIFRKPYFIGRFLPALLIPRKLPAEADTRARIIDDLNRAGKIPASMLRSYQKKCDQFKESSSSGKPRDNVQYLVDTLEKLPLLVINTIDAAETTKGLSSLLSSISRKVKLIFGDNVHETSSSVLNLDLASLDAKEDHIQASYAIMNAFCRTCAAVQNAKASESAASKRDLVKFGWASKFVSMLVSFPVLMESLYVHIWSTICHKPHLLENEHIYGLAILVCHLACSNRGPTCTICLQSSTSMSKGEYYQTFVDLLSNQTMLTSKNSVMFFIRWCCCYLQYAVVAFNTVTTNADQVLADDQEGSCYVPEIMVAKIRYLYHKLKFRKINSNGQAFLDDKNWDILQIVMKSLDTLKITQDQSTVSFSQWLLWELKIEEDFLRENERQQYYNWAIYEQFTSYSKQEIGDHFDYREAATQLFSVLMDHYSSEMDNIHSSTEMSLVKILQDIVYLIVSSHRQVSTKASQKESESIWLLDCFISRNRKVNSTGNLSRDLEQCCEIISFIRLATLLPPWLLFGNTEWYSLTGQNSKKLTCFLNNHLKPYMFQETFAVPFDFTAHLLKAFFSSTLKQGRENIRHHEEILQLLMREIPLFFGSLVHYWSQLKPVCNRYFVQSELLKQLNSYHLWLNNILDDQFIVPENIIDEAGLAYAVFLHLKKRLANSSIFEKEIGHISPGMAKLLDNLSTLCTSLQGKKVILYLFDNIMAYLVDLIFQGDEIKDEEVLFDISVDILSRCPHVLRVFTQKLEKNSELNTVRSMLVAENFSKLLPVIFFRIFIRFPKLNMQKTLSLEAFIKTVLIMYTDFSSIYKECAESSLSLSHWKLDLKSFVEVTRLVKDYLMNVSPTLLRSVSEDLIKMSPPEIQALFIRVKRSNCS